MTKEPVHMWACFIATTIDQVDVETLVKIVASKELAMKWLATKPSYGEHYVEDFIIDDVD